MRTNLIRFATLLLVVLTAAACSTDSPTEPVRQPASNPGTGAPSSVWNLTLVASPNEILVDGTNDVTSTISLIARRADNGQAPPNGATAVLASSLGNFTAVDGSDVSSVAIQLVNGQGGAVLTLPGTAATTAIVQAQLEQSFAQTSIRLEIPPDPPLPDPFFIDSLSPNVGPAGGSRVRINGSGFDPPIRVLFGPNPARLVAATSSVLTVETPPVEVEVNGALQVSVSVTINLNDTDPADVQATDTLPNSFTYVADQIPVPEITSVTPASGPNEGGTQVAIRGDGFEREVQVFFGRPTSLVEAQILNVSTTRIDALTPAATGVNSANENSIVNVQVINLDSGFTDMLASAFQYGNANDDNLQISAIDPNVGPLEGGNQVRIFGQGFDDPVSVSLADVLADVRSVTGSEIVVRAGVPPRSNGCADVSGAVTVTNIETNETTSGPTYIYEAIPPQILSITPASSPAAGGGNLRIRGIDLPVPDDPADILVVFGNTEGTVVNFSDREINATIPPFSGVFPTEACDDNGDGVQGERADGVTVSIRVIDRQNGCNATLSNAFSYVPPDTTCREAPAAAFAFSVNGLTVTFTNQTVGIAPITFAWDFGDGTGSAATSPVHPYGAAFAGQTVSVTLRATNAFGTTSATQSVTLPP